MCPYYVCVHICVCTCICAAGLHNCCTRMTYNINLRSPVWACLGMLRPVRICGFPLHKTIIFIDWDLISEYISFYSDPDWEVQDCLDLCGRTVRKCLVHYGNG